MRNAIVALIATLLLSGCSYLHVYRPDRQQGNIIKANKVNQLKLGMSPFEVKHIMGDPLLENTFEDNKLLYVYTFEPNAKPITEQRVVLTFRRDRLVKIEKQL